MDFQCPVKNMGKHLLRKGEWLREAAVAVDQMTAVDKVLGNPVQHRLLPHKIFCGDICLIISREIFSSEYHFSKRINHCNPDTPPASNNLFESWYVLLVVG